MLTVAIPTFNRAEKLRRSLGRVAEQSKRSAGLHIIVIDNASTDGTGAVVREVGEQYQVSIAYTRNVANIGLAGNVVRCLEATSTEWVWILGDDDPILDGALNSVLGVLAKADMSTVMINFSTGILSKNWGIRRDGDVYLDRNNIGLGLDSFSNLLFISANVLRRPAVLTRIGVAYGQMHSCTACLPAVLEAITSDGGKVLLSPIEVVDWEPVENGPQWPVEVSYGFASLGEILPEDQRTSFLARVLDAHGLPPLRKLAYWHLVSGDLTLARLSLRNSIYSGWFNGIRCAGVLFLATFLHPFLKPLLQRYRARRGLVGRRLTFVRGGAPRE